MWFQDEARIGQKNTLTRVWGQTGGRPAAAKDLGFISAYVFGAVCPGEGKAAAVIMPICNTIAMNHHLREISSQVGTAAHALLVLTPAPAEAGGAGWHDSQALAIPDNITLLALPPYSPELAPVERIWHYLRSHWLANSVFRSLADIMDACETAWNRFAGDPGSVRAPSPGRPVSPWTYTSAIHPDPIISGDPYKNLTRDGGVTLGTFAVRGASAESQPQRRRT